jgi:hypothetical protein
MSNRKKPEGAGHDDPFVRCADCKSTVHTVYHDGGTMTVEVEHSPSCPMWRDDHREIALMFEGEPQVEQ